MSEVKHYDNILVKRGKSSTEYFAISMSPIEEPYAPYEVSIRRYSVPGRCDTYYFDWEHDQSGPCRLRYFSDGQVPLAKTLALLAADLDKPQVVKLLVEAVQPEKHMHYSRQLVYDLLECLAPKSKSYRACKKAYDQMFEARKTRFAAQRERENRESTLLKVTPIPATVLS